MIPSQPQPSAKPSTAPSRILIVEDEFLIRLTLAEVLADEGYEVIEAETADEALTLLDDGLEIAMMLTDIQLPGKLDGRGLVRHLRQTRPNLPVIFMTGRPDSMSQGVGATELYVAKPYLPSEICTAVKKLLSA